MYQKIILFTAATCTWYEIDIESECIKENAYSQIYVYIKDFSIKLIILHTLATLHHLFLYFLLASIYYLNLNIYYMVIIQHLSIKVWCFSSFLQKVLNPTCFPIIDRNNNKLLE